MENRKIVDYYLVTSGCKEDLQRNIRRLLRQEWVLYEAPYFDGEFHCQALIKYEEDKNAVE